MDNFDHFNAVGGEFLQFFGNCPKFAVSLYPVSKKFLDSIGYCPGKKWSGSFQKVDSSPPVRVIITNVQ